MRASIRLVALVASILPVLTCAQVRAGAREFQITKIVKNLVPTPDYGIGQYRAATNERWLVFDRPKLDADSSKFAALPKHRRYTPRIGAAASCHKGEKLILTQRVTGP